MRHEGLKVCIIGAGTGGLCLAQGLKQDGIDVEVFERDHTVTDRLQGYRLSINATGRQALKACVPGETFDRLVSNGAKPSDSVTFLDHRLNRLLAIDLPHGPDSELPVSRIALRSILSEGLGDIVHYGKRCIGFAADPLGAVTAHLEDGSSAIADVLVAADGASSHLRAQLLPHARRVETGIVAVSGKLGLSDAVRRTTPSAILHGPTLILGPHGCFMFASAVDYEEGPAGGDSPYDRDRYVMWGFSAHDDTLDLPADPSALSGPDDLAAVLALMDDWHPDLQRLVQTADTASATAFSVKTSVPIEPWDTQRVTLLGDALHNMTPFRGIGANTALRDAAALRQALVAVARRDAELIPALAAYERDMVRYGFEAVQASLQNMERFHARGFLARTATKSLFHFIDRVPPLKSAFLGR
jgi:2-polyprenyl-6-methoxyphenol hydroxylase-like FAD-dependent oxidoreductase